MVTGLFSIFIILHGLVHLLYFGQSQRYFELQPGLHWPDGSWAFSRLLGDETTRFWASLACGLAAFGFVIGGVGLLLDQEWWRLVVIGGAAFSSIVYALLWDGSTKRLDEQGAIGLLINFGLILAVLLLEF